MNEAILNERCRRIAAQYDQGVRLGPFQKNIDALQMTDPLGSPSQATSLKLENAEVARFDRHHKNQIPNTLRNNALRVLGNELLQVNDNNHTNVPIDANVYAMFEFMRKRYEKESNRVAAILLVVQHLLACKNVQVIEAQNSPIKIYPSDLTAGRINIFAFLEGLGIPVCILEVRNEENLPFQSEANFQALTYFIIWFKDKYKIVLNNWPCVTLCLRGTVLSVRCLVFSDCTHGDHRVVETCLSTLDVSSSSRIQALANTFAAVRKCIASLVDMHVQCVNDALAARPKDFRAYYQYMFPCCNELLSMRLKFTYNRVVEKSKRVFRATVSTDSPCKLANNKLIVKFVSGGYCADLHHFLASQGMAPPLYGVQSLGYYDWKMVVMADGSTADMLTLSTDLTAVHLAQEVSLLKSMHSAGFVHGDFRFTNLLYSAEGSVQAIDFDWAGLSGTVRYPLDIALGAGIGYHGEVQGGGVIEVVHDQHFLHVRYQHLQDELVRAMEDLTVV